MPEEQKNGELKYFERLNISVLSIDKIKNLIKTNIKNTIRCWEKDLEIEKQTFHIIGPAGIGKTQICLQIAGELKEETGKPFSSILIKCPVLSRDDFLIPFPVTHDGQLKFKMLYSDFIPLESDSFGIFIIDEFARGDHSLQQLMWQSQNEYKVHLADFPKGWFIVTLDNPDDQEYSMDYLEDAAGLRRTLHVYTEVSPTAFLDYAISKKYHRSVIEFIQTHPDFLYDFDAQRVGSVYANPASYERLSNILIGYETQGPLRNFYEEIEPLAAGLLNTNKTRLFMEFLKDMKDINPKDIFYNYPKVRGEVLKYVEQNDNARLGELIASFTTYILTSRPNYKREEMENVAQFLVDMPIDTAAVFVSQVDTVERDSEAFRYVTKLHVALMKSSTDYKEKFYEAIVAVGSRD